MAMPRRPRQATSAEPLGGPVVGKARSNAKESAERLEQERIEFEAQQKEEMERRQTIIMVNHKRSSKNFFQMINRLKTHQMSNPPIMNDEGKLEHNVHAKREILADYFLKMQTIPKEEDRIRDWENFLNS